MPFNGPKTLWFNTGTLCNLECQNCYIESSPKNDSLVYLSSEDIKPYLSEIKSHNWKVKELGFTGGEPFLNPHMFDILTEVLSGSRVSDSASVTARPTLVFVGAR